jgi:hypothetical protein
MRTNARASSGILFSVLPENTPSGPVETSREP